MKTILHLDELLPSLHKGFLVEERHAYPFDDVTVEDDWEVELIPNSEGVLPTVIFNVSLNGDDVDECLKSYKINLNLFNSAELIWQEQKVDSLLQLGALLVEQGVKVVICQKIVHTHLRRYLLKSVNTSHQIS